VAADADEDAELAELESLAKGGVLAFLEMTESDADSLIEGFCWLDRGLLEASVVRNRLQICGDDMGLEKRRGVHRFIPQYRIALEVCGVK